MIRAKKSFGLSVGMAITVLAPFPGGVMAQSSPPRAPVLCVDTACGDALAPYLLPDAVLASIPWHNASGSWGARRPVEIPTPPTTTRSVSVSTAAALQTQAANSNIVITLTASVDENSIARVTGNHVDIVIPSGIVGPAIEVRNNASFVRIRGTIPGQRSGGRVGSVRVGFGGSSTDVIVDGLDVNGSAYGTTGGESNMCFRPGNTLRMGIYRTRCIAGTVGLLDGGGTDPIRGLVIVDSNFFCGALTAAETGDPAAGGYCVRTHGGPVTLVNSSFANTRYPVIRAHPFSPAGNNLLAMVNTDIIAYGEARPGSLWTAIGAPSPRPGDGLYWNNGRVYAHSTVACGYTTIIWIDDVPIGRLPYSRISNIQWHNAGLVNFTQAYIDSVEAARVGDHDYSVGHTFSNWTTRPNWGAWNTSGNPEQVPLPGGRAFSYGQGVCLGPSLQ